MKIEWTYACKLEHFGSEILKHSGDIDCGLCADTHLVLRVLLEEALDTATWELERSVHVSTECTRWWQNQDGYC
jgi:hypothetical protein